jgi:outer membrane protein assembly factor BamB
MKDFYQRAGWGSLLLAWALLGAADSAGAAEWYHWRGPFQTGVSPDKNLPATWSDDPKTPENFLWKAPFPCRSTPIVMNGRVYINNQVGQGVNEQERVMCLDAKTGKPLWEQKFSVFHTDIVSVRLGWTNLVGDPATERVYWQGTQGYFVCFDKNGKIVWEKSLIEEYGRVAGYGGRLPSPIVVDDLVILGMINSSWGDQGKGANRFLALNKSDGTPVWWSEPTDKPGTYYSTPTVAVINGEKLVISGCADGAIHAMQAGTGKPVWSYRFCQGAINCAPVVSGTYVYANHGEESPGTNVQGRIICVDAAKIKDGHPELVWKEDGVKAKYTSPLVHDGRVYICDDTAQLWCFDGSTGKKYWGYVYGRNAFASPVWGDGKIYVADKNSKFHILKPGPKNCKHLDEHFFESVAGADVELYANAAIAAGRVYFATSEETYCIGTKDPEVVAVPAGAPPINKGQPAQLLIYPCDVRAAAGSSTPLIAKIYDQFGNYLETALPDQVKWSLPQPPLPPTGKNQPPALKAEIMPPAKLVLAKMPAVQQGYVEAQWQSLKGRARARVAPPLPYTQDFEKVPEGAVPAGWINCQGKFLVKKLPDGNQVLAKVTTNSNPLVARGPCFLGTPEMTNYTIEADVRGGEVVTEKIVDKKVVQAIVWMPDVGVGACRYTLMLAGQTKTLRLVSWDAMPRVDETLPFPWKADTWYTLKLRAEVAGGKVTLRGKVWPKGNKEPASWDIEFTDPTPNLEGSPFLYGYVQGNLENNVAGTEVWFDNVRVTPN